jgi:hypothetical protein
LPLLFVGGQYLSEEYYYILAMVIEKKVTSIDCSEEHHQ